MSTAHEPARRESRQTGLFNLAPVPADIDPRTTGPTQEPPTLLMHAMRRRLAVDEGMSIIEVLIALVILAVVLSAAASALASSLFAMAQNENRTKATALANEELENLRILTWEHVGFFDDDYDGWDAADIPANWVDLDPEASSSERPAGSPAPLPTETVTRGGIDFTVTRAITWVNNPQADGLENYKRLHVTVEWFDRALERSITVESDRAPLPDEQQASLFALSVFDVQPDLVAIDSSGAAATTLEFTGLTSANATWVYFEYRDRAGTLHRVYLLNPSGDARTWEKTYTAGTYPNGEVEFIFSGTRNPDPDIVEVLGSKLVLFLQPVDFISLEVAPQTSFCLEGDEPAPELTFTATIEGMLESDEVVLTWDGNEAQVAQVSSTVAGSEFMFVVDEGEYGDGETTFTVTATRLADETPDPVSESAVVTVQRVDAEEGC